MGNGTSVRSHQLAPTASRKSFNMQRIQDLYQRLFSTPANPCVIPVLGSDWFTYQALPASQSHRSSTCDFILTNLRNKTDAALSCVKGYLGSAQNDYPKIFYGDAAIDFVLSCTMPQPLDVATSTDWASFKTILPGVMLAQSTVLDSQLGYAQIIIQDGMERGVPLYLNVLYRRYVRDHRVIIVVQSITNDELFEINQSRVLSLSAWLVFDYMDENTTQARSILRCEAKLDAVPSAIQVKDDRLTVHTQWILHILSGMYAPVSNRPEVS
ncbi:hypothetical protein THRCLA_04100 [Thraustotheca clavata]|uniref:Uncharacterized protein n=1 Tax=Thraustotheca clavata TaxID=74557 RepID=A0A1V9ZZZ2_9STRA|nr:hypothetical protein THRCLA_04100 [Thraustotheca clavata]